MVSAALKLSLGSSVLAVTMRITAKLSTSEVEAAVADASQLWKSIQTQHSHTSSTSIAHWLNECHTLQWDTRQSPTVPFERLMQAVHMLALNGTPVSESMQSHYLKQSIPSNLIALRASLAKADTQAVL